MKTSIFHLALILFLLTACKQNDTPSSMQATSGKKVSKFSFEQTHQANGYTFAIKANNGESTTILLESKGLENEFLESRIVKGQVKESFMLDIDNNGHKEFYLAIESSDDSGNIVLRAYVANASKSISEATVMDDQLGIRDMNSDQLKPEAQGLVRRFKVDGKEAEFRYTLMRSGAGHLVIPMITQQ